MDGGLISLFIGSLLASTLLPGGVEALLYYLVKQGDHQYWSLLSTATIGNTLGGIITWWVGFYLFKGFKHKGWHQRVERWFNLESKSLQRTKKWGVYSLLLSWMPIIGDPLCLAAGYLQLRFWPSALMIFIGKFGRYIALLWLLQ